MADETTTVPPDHHVQFFLMSVEPALERTQGGCVIASLGVAGDDPDRELDQIIGEIDRSVAGTARANVVNASGTLPMSELFAPATPMTVEMKSPVAWVLHQGAVLSLMASARRREVLARCIHRLSAVSIEQRAYIVDPIQSATVAAFVRLMHQLGVAVRHPDTTQQQLVVQIEVKRPDGRILSVFPGVPVADDTKPGELRALDADALAEHVKRIEVLERAVAFRSPRLRKQVIELDARKNDVAAVTAFVEDICNRELPLLLLRDPNSEQLELRAFSGHKALPAYADVTCLEWAAVDLAKAKGSYVPGPVDPRNVVMLAAKGNLGLAICTYRDRKTPMYTVIPAGLIGNVARRLGASAAAGR